MLREYIEMPPSSLDLEIPLDNFQINAGIKSELIYKNLNLITD
jgi:hypothetical protein